MCTCVVSLSCVMRVCCWDIYCYNNNNIWLVFVRRCLHVSLANYRFVNLARRCAKLYVLRCVIIQQV